jgi:hypothetical protein
MKEGMKNEETENTTSLKDSLDLKKEEADIPVADDAPLKVSSGKKPPRVDYASTVEGAYKDLSNILGSDGIKNLTKDTKHLMDQQVQLAEAMKSMGPLLESAKSMLDGFDMKNLGGFADIAKQITGK